MNRKNSSKNERRTKEVADTAIRMSESNPYEWYANFPNYAKDVASLAFGTPVGQAVRLRQADWVASDGIMGLYFTPCIGYSADMTSPVNRQAVRTFSYLRSIQRAAANYDSADLMMYMLGIDSLYAYWAFLRRAYGVAQLFTPVNKYYPRRLLHVMGIDDTIVYNLADFRAYINRFALNIGRFAMPKSFDLTQRHMWMNSGLYLDSQGRRAQTYVFVPYKLWQWDNTVTTGSQLTGITLVDFNDVKAGSNRKTLNQLIAFGEDLLTNFNNDDDTMAISGDLYRAYGNNLMHVEETPDNYAIAPVYDEVVLSQIENATLVGTFRDRGGTAGVNPVITQDPSVNNGAILFTPSVSAGPTDVGDGVTSKYGRNYGLITENVMLNAHWDSPTPEQVMEMTRLVARLDPNTNPISGALGDGVAIKQCGSDLLNGIAICAPARNSQVGVSFLTATTNTIWCKSDGTPYNPDAASLIAHFMQFDWAPMLYLVLDNGSSQDLQTVAADVDNFTTASYDQMFMIQEAAMLSLLDSPEPVQK